MRARSLLLLALCAASAAAQSVKIRPEVLTHELEHPWAIAFIGNDRMLVTERPGRMRVVEADGKLGAPLDGVPKVEVGGQGGLHDLVTDRDFAHNRALYFCYVEPGTSSGTSTIAMASAHLPEDAKRLEQVKVLFRAKPQVRGNLNFGCRIVDNGDGTLFLSVGDRFTHQDDAQKLDSDFGKIVRIRKDGSIPPDNPFLNRKSALPEIWSYGHRNPQGMTLGPDGKLWIDEHGPQGGDEINRPEAGKNYGWPVITYGENYGGGKIGEGISAKEGMEQPLHYWTPSIAPSGMAFLLNDKYGKAWKGSLFVGSLKFRYLDRIELRDNKVVKEEKLLQDRKQRIRDVRVGRDGLIYVLTDEEKGELIRLRPE